MLATKESFCQAKEKSGKATDTEGSYGKCKNNLKIGIAINCIKRPSLSVELQCTVGTQFKR